MPCEATWRRILGAIITFLFKVRQLAGPYGATLSLITRKNSRHPLLLIGLIAFGILFVGQQFLERAATEEAWVIAQATEIIAGRQLTEPQVLLTGIGAYVGFAASAALTLFGLTIVVRRVTASYPEPEDDDL